VSETLKIGVLNGVTDGARTRDLRSHNPYEHVRVCPNPSWYVAYIGREPYVRGVGHPYVSGCVLASIAAALLPLLPQVKPMRCEVVSQDRRLPYVGA
jgi:hypothetical protein